MSVYTRVDHDDLRALLADYAIGELEDFRGIAAGITNTNYFVDTTTGRWVLTLFEQVDTAALPFFMQLMDHLAGHGVPGAHPVARNDGGFLSEVRGRPAALVYRLSGASIESPEPAQCGSLGGVVAEMHRAVRSFGLTQDNTRDLAWLRDARARLGTRLDTETRTLLDDELAYQSDCARTCYVDLPRAVIHADMFRDNVLFQGQRVSGIIDFYFACQEYLLFDLAVICNDWAYDDQRRHLPDHWAAFAGAYHRRRPLTDAEIRAWPAMLRAAALRFWVSRLVDYHFPMDGDVVHIHDPTPFEALLRRHREQAPSLIPS
ncbi:homoserine kinase [Salinisphaera orenii]|uniref:Homoserine kinase n=1 Tax=Salinisphaera orenii YIM 95161 TaxID=1051139 RepID=A0A423PI60_9GAMM|nr:homoserine kinase [Salinisphaera halophila]ROO25287.1 homoserine kinase [Salinisphaera halophila YIM 95161]